MIRLFLTSCEKRSEHKTGIMLALYAIRYTFGVNAALAYTDKGKPYVNISGIYVSISHSDGLCAAAVSDTVLGVDIERSKCDRNIGRLLRITERYFTAVEYEYVLADPRVRFWEIWTAKESFIKFTGEGFSRSLKSFSVFDTEMNYNKFIFLDYTGCVCSRESADILPIFVDIDEISL
jgi:4'-phosphopantetheinyl transferase